MDAGTGHRMTGGFLILQALFTLAHKISPCVIFVDEVDSLLGRRDKSGEHEVCPALAP